MASIRWTVGAREDLRQILGYIGRDSPTYAAATVERIIQAVGVLRRHPMLGRVVREYDDRSIRELIVGSYRVVYRYRERRVGIVAVVHGGRDLVRRVTSDPWDFG